MAWSFLFSDVPATSLESFHLHIYFLIPGLQGYTDIGSVSANLSGVSSISALAAHVRDVWSRLGSLKVAVTSVYGIPLEIDFTKKIC